MKNTNKKHLHMGNLAFIGGWWTLLLIFCSTGLGHLGILWFAVTVVYFVFHPDTLVPAKVTINWNPVTIEHLFELIATTMFYASVITFVAWDIAWREGALQAATDPLFFIIGFSFLLMSGVAMSGVTSYLFVRSESHSMGPRIFLFGGLIIYSIISHFFPEWIFTHALYEIRHKFEFYVMLAALFSFLAYYLLKKLK